MLSVVPRAVQVSASGGTVVHRLINSSGAYLAFKIKSTNKKDYRLRPVYGVIGPQGSYCINVQRLPGAASEDVFVVQYAEVRIKKRGEVSMIRFSQNCR